MKLLILLMFISMPASAEWVLVERVNLEVIGDYTVYANSSSIEKVGDYTRMLVLKDYYDTQTYVFPFISPPMSEYRSTLAMAEFDCAKGKQRWAASSFFSENKGYGTKHDLGGYTAWYPIKGRSFRIACGKGK